VSVMERDVVFEDPAAPSAGAWPFLGLPVWPARLRGLQEHPGRWARWRGCSTSTLARSMASVRWAARGLAGTYEFRTGECEAGGPLTFVRWTPPADDRSIDLRPLARAETFDAVGLVVADSATGQLVATSVEGAS
jgi:hypothetical protein